MSKRVFIVFGLVVLVLAVLIPWLAFRDKGDASTGPQKVAAQYEHGQELFQINCGTCHTLYAAGTNGNYAPDLDELLVPTGERAQDKATIDSTTERVLNAVENGVDSSTTPGRMPAGILNRQQAKEVAEFVGAYAGEG
jgi:mono/diheme cytochrome c family protein